MVMSLSSMLTQYPSSDSSTRWLKQQALVQAAGTGSSSTAATCKKSLCSCRQNVGTDLWLLRRRFHIIQTRFEHFDTSRDDDLCCCPSGGLLTGQRFDGTILVGCCSRQLSIDSPRARSSTASLVRQQPVTTVATIVQHCTRTVHTNTHSHAPWAVV